MKRLVIFMLALMSAPAYSDVEIIVTASRIEEDPATTPAYVRVITDEELSGAASVVDVLKTIPDIIVTGYSSNQLTVSMGGFGENGFARTLILIDGRPVNRPDMASFDWKTIPLSRVERIEIVKGAMSSLYGDQAVSGVINIITKQEAEGLDIEVEASLNSEFSNTQSVYTSFGDATAGFSFNLDRNDYNSTRENADSDSYSGSLDVYYSLDNLKTGLGLYYTQGTYCFPGSLSEAEYEADPDQSNTADDFADVRSYGATATLETKLAGLEISLPLSYGIVENDTDMASWVSYTSSRLDMFNSGLKTAGEYFLGENSVLSPVAGIDFKYTSLTEDTFSDSSRSSVSSTSDLSRMDGGIWGRVKLNYLDTLIVDGGVRFGYALLEASEDVSYPALSGDLGAAWLPSEALKMSLRYGRIFRYPLLDEQVSWGVLNEDLMPESGHNLTASIEYSLSSLSLSLSPYLLFMNDEIAYNSATFQNENMGNTLHYGTTLSADYSSAIVSVSASYAFDHATDRDTGYIIPLVPMHKIFGSVGISPVKGLSLSASVRYSSGYYQGGDTSNSSDPVEGRMDLNARMDWSVSENVIWYLTADNILDDRTPVYVYYSGYYPPDGRVFGTGIKWVY